MKSKISALILISLFLLKCGIAENNNFIKINNLNEKEKRTAYSYIETLKQKIPVFSILLEKLNDAKQIVNIHFTDSVKIGGFSPKNSSSLNLYFKSLNEFLDENIILEEFFHAYQAMFYGHETMLHDENGIIKGAVNLEYEAKLFKALSALQNDQANFETPSQKGLLDFALSLIDNSGKLKSYKLDYEQHKQYIRHVLHFQQHWKKRNMVEQVKSVYDHPIDSALGPDACLNLFKQLR
jgi:hypothetical protein